MSVDRLVVVVAVSLASVCPVATRADQVDDAYRDFSAGQYEQVFKSLFAFRVLHEGTLRVDFMLGVSACRLSDSNFKALGGFLLAEIPNWYSPLRSDQLRDVRTQAQSCPSAGITEEQAVARVSGKTDTAGAQRLMPKRSDAGKDQALPAVPVRSGPVVVPPPPSSMSRLIEEGVQYRLVAQHSGKCLDVSGSSTADSTPLMQYSCHGKPNQRFSIRQAGGNYYQIVAQNSDKCLDVLNGSTEDLASIVQYSCHGGDNQLFRLVTNGVGSEIVAKHSSKCLDVLHESVEDGATIVQFACHGGGNQIWALQQ